VQIRTKLTLQFSVLVSTIVLVTFFVIYILTEDFAQRDFYRRLREKAITSAILLIKVDQVDSALLQVIDRAKRDNFYREAVHVFNQEDKEIYFSGDTVTLPITPEILSEIRKRNEYQFELNGFHLNGILFKDGDNNYASIVAAIDIHGMRRLTYLKTILSVAFFILSGVVLAAGWVYSGRALKPLQRIMDDVESLSPQNLDQRLKEGKHQDEMGKLIFIFNKLLDRIANAFNLQKMFVSNVSHELKNPLTNITSQLEVTLLKERSKEEYRETIESVLEDIKSLNLLSNSLLELARLTRDTDSFSMSRVRLDEILWDARDSVKSIDPSYQVEIEIRDMPDDENKLYVEGNLYLLKTAFQNIIENACKFSTDMLAEVTLSVTEEYLIVKVQDRGPGIDNKDIDHVFEPFFRTDATSKVRGYGIGLSLCNRIISIHKGKIEINSTPGKGTMVIVKLNTAKSF
jgi:signal transduction histidine kinase